MRLIRTFGNYASVRFNNLTLYLLPYITRATTLLLSVEFSHAVFCYAQTLGSDLNGVERQQRDFVSARYSCAGAGRTSPSDLDPPRPFTRVPGPSPEPSVGLDLTGPLACTTGDLDPPGPFVRGSGAVPASGVQGGLFAAHAAADVDHLAPGGSTDLLVDSKPTGTCSADHTGRRTSSGLTGVTGRSPPGSSKSVGTGGVSSSGGSSTGNGSASAMYETGSGNDVKHQQLDYVGAGTGGLLSSDPLHYYPHLGGVASSAGFSPYQPARHHPHRHHHPGSHAHGHAHQVLSPAGTAAYAPYAMPDLVGDYTSTSAFFHSNVFKAAAAASQIRTKSHSSSGQLGAYLLI